MFNTRNDYVRDFLLLPLIAAENAGMYSHALFILIMGAPTFLLDKGITSITGQCTSFERNEYSVSASNLFHSITHSNKKSLTVYQGGFFSKYPVGVIAEKAGLVVNAAVSATTFVATAATGFALVASACAIILAIALIYLAVNLARSFLNCVLSRNNNQTVIVIR
jgi:hypothetical protein